MSGGELPPLILELRARAGQALSEIGAVNSEVKKLDATAAEAAGGSGGLSRTSRAFSGLASVGKAALFGIVGGAAIVGAVSLKMGMDFQESTTQLVTGAGESEKNIDLVRKGILAMAGAVGQSPLQLSKGMYLIESAGYHGAAGLNVLKAAAEGAKVGGADMATVADGLTTALTDYNLPASRAAAVTSALVQTVADGKTTMQDLSSSLGMVLPKASAMGITFSQVSGAMATMTGAGMSARRASMNLANTIMSLGAPGKAATNALKSIGLTAQQVKDDLTNKGLNGTLQEITDAVGKKFPAGSVAGVTALKNIMGGTTGYGTALALTGSHMKAFIANANNISVAYWGQSKSVQGFAETQKDLAFKVASAKASLEALGVKIGMWLIPKVQQATVAVMNIVTWFEKHKTVAEALGIAIGSVLTVAIAAYTVDMIGAAAATIAATWPVLAIIAAVAAAGVGIFYLATHWKQVWSDIKQWTKDAVDFIKQHLTLILTVILGPFGFALAELIRHWKQVWTDVKAVLLDVWNGAIRPTFHAVMDAVGAVGDAVKVFVAIWKAQFDIVQSVVSAVWNFLKPVFVAVVNVGLFPIRVAIAALRLLWLASWDAIRSITSAAWGVLSPIFRTLVTVGLWQIRTEIEVLRDAWNAAWGVVKATVSAVWGFLSPIFRAVVSNGINLVKGAIQDLENVWDAVWGTVKAAVSDAWNFIQPILSQISRAVNDTLGVVGKVAHFGGSMLSKIGLASGGWVPAAVGVPVPATVHGGEYMLSNDMLAGRAPIDPHVLSAIGAGRQKPSGMPVVGGASSVDHGTQVLENHTHVYLDGAQVQHSMERRQLQVGLRRGGARTYQAFSK